MPAVVQKVGGAGQWNVTVKLYEADGTTLATVYKDPNGDATGANPLPKQRAVGDFGVDTAGNWTVYLPAGDYQVGVRPSGGSETKTAFTLTATPDADVGYELTAVFGVRADGDVPVWNETDQRLEWGAAGGSGVVQSVVAGANVTVDDTDPANPVVASSGGSGTVRLVEATVHFDTANILTGAAIYTPTPGDWIPPGYYNFSVSVPVAFNGTTPLLTLGAIVGGVFVALTPVAGTAADHADAGEPGIPDFIDPGGGSLTVSDVSALLFNGVTPLAIKLDDGAGGDPGSTAGTAKIVFLVATPTPA